VAAITDFQNWPAIIDFAVGGSAGVERGANVSTRARPFLHLYRQQMAEKKGWTVVARWLAALPICASVMMLTGCVQVVDPEPTWVRNVSAAEAVGALAGGALGGYLGAQFGAGSGALAMTGLGVAAGAALGREIGSSLETANRPTPPPYVVLPYGHCLRPSNGSASVPSASQAGDGWSITAC
jgi:uncharacterized protein YcfJ